MLTLATSTGTSRSRDSATIPTNSIGGTNAGDNQNSRRRCWRNIPNGNASSAGAGNTVTEATASSSKAEAMPTGETKVEQPRLVALFLAGLVGGLIL